MNGAGVYAAIALEVYNDSAVDLVDNQIDGGLGRGIVSTVGVHRSPGRVGALRLIGNRIFGGSTPGASWQIFGARASPAPVRSSSPTT